MEKAKSFYIFDLDDNIIHTGTQTIIYHKETAAEVCLTSADFVKERDRIGKSGPFKDYLIDSSLMGSYRNFNDSPEHDHYPFLNDLQAAVSQPGWQGPSWARFVKAVDRERTMSIITARGHCPARIEEGIKWLAQEGFLPKVPDIHSIYSITSPETQNLLRWTGPDLISTLKKQALQHFIEEVYKDFGHTPAHRFGFSDDDPSNINSTRQKFIDLKQRNPHHSFFLYHARPKEVLEEEILLDHIETQ